MNGRQCPAQNSIRLFTGIISSAAHQHFLADKKLSKNIVKPTMSEIALGQDRA
jgi:hypothetical protein